VASTPDSDSEVKRKKEENNQTITQQKAEIEQKKA